MSQGRTTAVVVTYQSRATIGKALRAARESHERGALQVVVVDNGSSDGTADLVRREYPWVKVVESGGNIGFARGCNLGFQHVNTPFMLLLNPDAVLSHQALSTMVAFMEAHPQAGIVGPAIRGSNGGLQQAGLMPTAWGLVRAAAGRGSAHANKRRIIPGERPFQTDWLCGAVLLIRTNLFAELGGFDSRFFLYFEETDLCRRARQCGIELWAVGDAVAEHVVSASVNLVRAPMIGNCIAEHFFRSRFYYLTKHYGRPVAVWVELSELALLVARSVANRCIRRPGHDMCRLRLAGPILRLPATPDRVEHNAPV